jgi:hypothetical protein
LRAGHRAEFKQFAKLEGASRLQISAGTEPPFLCYQTAALFDSDPLFIFLS